LLNGLLVILDERLVEQLTSLRYFCTPPSMRLATISSDWTRFASGNRFGSCLGCFGSSHRALALDQIGRHVGTGQGDGLHRGDMHRHILGRRVVAFELDHDTDTRAMQVARELWRPEAKRLKRRKDMFSPILPIRPLRTSSSVGPKPSWL
jgi:hypothetical protein